MTTCWPRMSSPMKKKPRLSRRTKLKKDAAAGPLEITAKVRYAVCDAKVCLPPKTKEVRSQ